MEWTHIEEKWTAMACRLQQAQSPGGRNATPQMQAKAETSAKGELPDTPIQKDDTPARVTA